MRGTTNIPAVCVLIRKNNKLLMFRREHTDFQDGKYCVPAGHVEPGETFREAAVRETLEEVGLQLRPDDLRHLHTQHTKGLDTRIHLFFEATSWAGEPQNMEPHKHGPLTWLPIDNLPFDEIMPLVAGGLQAIARGDSYAEFKEG